eukprot:5560851-Pleurochrysis_carterae.AAC.1
MAQDLGLPNDILRAAGEIAELKAKKAGASTTVGPSADSRDNANSGLRGGRSKFPPKNPGSLATTTASQFRAQWCPPSSRQRPGPPLVPSSEQVVLGVRGHGNEVGKGVEAPSCGEQAAGACGNYGQSERGMTGGREQFERGTTGWGASGKGHQGAGRGGQDGRWGQGQGAAGEGIYTQFVQYNQGEQFCQGSGYLYGPRGLHGPHSGQPHFPQYGPIPPQFFRSTHSTLASCYGAGQGYFETQCGRGQGG